MMKYFFCNFFCLIFLSIKVIGQDTFSMIAIDSATGEIGSAGASCVDLIPIGYATSFLSDLIPGIGGANTQAAYLSLNQRNAKTRINRKDSAHIVLDWLIQNDAEANPEIRQYGIVTFVGGSPQAAAYSGNDCLDYKGHRVGSNYSIQGNILLGPEVLDSMEARFVRTGGSLACRLMYAMQGANIVGADSRCAANGTSSLFAFLKVTKPSDVINKPYISLGVKTTDGAGIEPIDSLQKLFDISGINCGLSGNHELSKHQRIRLQVNPIQNYIEFICEKDLDMNSMRIELSDLQGKNILLQRLEQQGSKLRIVPSVIEPGFYLITLQEKDKVSSFKIIKQ